MRVYRLITNQLTTCRFIKPSRACNMNCWSYDAVMRFHRLLSRRLTSSLYNDVTCRRARYDVTSRARGVRASYVHGTGTVPLTASTIGELLQQRAEMRPDHEAIVVCHQNTRLTFQQLLLQVYNQFHPSSCTIISFQAVDYFTPSRQLGPPVSALRYVMYFRFYG